MKNELHPCTKVWCYIPDLLIHGYQALWPVWYYPEDSHVGRHIWTFHVNWTETRHTKVNKVHLCEKHHKQILRMFTTEAAGDRQEQEVTEAWLVKMGSRMVG